MRVLTSFLVLANLCLSFVRHFAVRVSGLGLSVLLFALVGSSVAYQQL